MKSKSTFQSIHPPATQKSQCNVYSFVFQCWHWSHQGLSSGPPQGTQLGVGEQPHITNPLQHFYFPTIWISSLTFYQGISGISTLFSQVSGNQLGNPLQPFPAAEAVHPINSVWPKIPSHCLWWNILRIHFQSLAILISVILQLFWYIVGISFIGFCYYSLLNFVIVCTVRTY